jgi:hypothetical protein
MSQHRLGRWETEAKTHLLKYRPKMAAQLQAGGKLDDWARNAAQKAGDQAGMSIENGMQLLEAEGEAKRAHMFLPAEEDQSLLGEDLQAIPDPASLVTTPGANARRKLKMN